MAEEGDTQRAIMDTLEALGYRVLRHNTGRRGHQKLGMKVGTPDLYVPVQLVSLKDKTARACWLEVKASKGVLSDDQKRWAREANDNGEYVACVRSVNEALDAVKRAANGERGPDPEVA